MGIRIRTRFFICSIIGALVFGVPATFGPEAVTVSVAEASHSSSGWRESASTQKKIRKLSKKAVKELRVPVIGVSAKSLSDTWGDARSSGRTHEGIDIIAKRGTLIVSPTDAVVTRIGDDNLGGKVVYTANPGGERFYYAHLDRFAKGLKVGQVLKPGDLIGYVGNTGNASHTIPHLHLGIYKKGALNPFPRLKKTFTAEEQRSFLVRELELTKKELAKND